MSDTFGYGLYGAGKYQPEVDNGYGYALYGTGVFGSVTIRIDGEAAITSVSTVTAAGGYLISGASAITSISTVAAAAGYVLEGAAAITSVSTVVADNAAGGVIKTASAQNQR